MDKERYLLLVQTCNEQHQKQLRNLAKRFINPIRVGDIVSSNMYGNGMRTIRVESIEQSRYGFDTVILVGTVIKKDGSPAKCQTGNRISENFVELINGKPLKEPRVKSWAPIEYEIDPDMYD